MIELYHCYEALLGIYLGRFEGVVWRKVDLDHENTTCIGAITRPALTGIGITNRAVSYYISTDLEALPELWMLSTSWMLHR